MIIPLDLLKKLAKPLVKKLGREVAKEVAQDALAAVEKKAEATLGIVGTAGQVKKSKGELLLVGAKWIVILLLGLAVIGLLGIVTHAWTGQEFANAAAGVLSALLDLL